MSTESFLHSLAGKAEMHRLIDELPEGGTALLITSPDIEAKSFAVSMRCLGPYKQSSINWILDHIKIWMLSGGQP